ncbi:hypothetical protein EUGRSUZ_B03117 [Eucalyptus grandis]|uniref:Uncharacterized protein n=2 Tax=Eucalyptus grandis TaxID=71139 RepID=A0ACC3LUY4_EUCGR|nr:hypothetical protein EUGRSUZ_B03117 [Eucalyptus grandis]
MFPHNKNLRQAKRLPSKRALQLALIRRIHRNVPLIHTHSKSLQYHSHSTAILISLPNSSQTSEIEQDLILYATRPVLIITRQSFNTGRSHGLNCLCLARIALRLPRTQRTPVTINHIGVHLGQQSFLGQMLPQRLRLRRRAYRQHLRQLHRKRWRFTHVPDRPIKARVPTGTGFRRKAVIRRMQLTGGILRAEIGVVETVHELPSVDDGVWRERLPRLVVGPSVVAAVVASVSTGKIGPFGGGGECRCFGRVGEAEGAVGGGGETNQVMGVALPERRVVDERSGEREGTGLLERRRVQGEGGGGGVQRRRGRRLVVFFRVLAEERVQP